MNDPKESLSLVEKGFLFFFLTLIFSLFLIAYFSANMGF